MLVVGASVSSLRLTTGDTGLFFFFLNSDAGGGVATIRFFLNSDAGGGVATTRFFLNSEAGGGVATICLVLLVDDVVLTMAGPGSSESLLDKVKCCLYSEFLLLTMKRQCSLFS